MRKYAQNCSGLHLSWGLPQMMPHKRGSAHVRAFGRVEGVGSFVYEVQSSITKESAQQ